MLRSFEAGVWESLRQKEEPREAVETALMELEDRDFTPRSRIPGSCPNAGHVANWIVLSTMTVTMQLEVL